MRRPAVAGHFYAGDKNRLLAELKRCFESPLGPGSSEPPSSVGDRSIIGAMSPHAGYMFSGPVAAHLYRRLWDQEPPSTVVILGPNHTGVGPSISLGKEDFQTPLGIAPLDEEIVGDLAGDFIVPDSSAHISEHSIEVQIPFMQFLGWNFKIVPICVGVLDFEAAAKLGKTIREAVKDRDDVLVIASSDMSHYVLEETAKEKDRKAIDKMLTLDSRGLFDTVISENISMCGMGPTVGMMEAIESSHASLLKYATSGDVQPMREVVGYAAVSFEK